MAFGVGCRAAQSVLLVRPQHDAHRAPRTKPQLHHQPHGFPRDDASHAIVRRARADVPRIEMPAEQHDLVRLLASDDLADDVGRLDVGLATPFEQKPQTHAAAGASETHEAVGVLGCESRQRESRSLPGRSSRCRCAPFAIRPARPIARAPRAAPCCAAARAPPLR